MAFSSSSSIPSLKILFITLDGGKHKLVVDRCRPDQDFVTIKEVRAAIARNPDLASLGLAHEAAVFEILDTDFEEYLAVGCVTEIYDKSRIRVKSVPEKPQTPPKLVAEVKPSVNNTSAVAPKNCDEPKVRTDIGVEATNVHKEQLINDRDWRDAFFDAITTNKGEFRGKSVHTAWRLVAEELNRTLCTDHWSVTKCINSFLTQVGYYFNAMKTTKSVIQAQNKWRFFNLFHYELELELLCDNIHRSKLGVYREDFRCICAGSLPRTEPSSAKKPEKRHLSSANFWELIEIVEKFTPSFENRGIPSGEVWKQIGDELSSRGFICPQNDFKTKFVNGLVGQYINTLKFCSDVSMASRSWPYFEKFHYDLKLEVICGESQMEKISECRKAFNGFKKVDYGHPSSSKELTNATFNSWFAEERELLMAIQKFSREFADWNIPKPVIWEKIACEMSKAGFNQSANAYLEKFRCGVISKYYDCMKKFPDVQKAEKFWPHFTYLHTELKLETICTDNQWANIRWAREQFMNLQGPRDHEPVRISTSDSSSFDRELLKAIVKHDDLYSSDKSNAFWALIATELRSQQLGCGDLPSQRDDCRQRFLNLLNMFESRLAENVDSGSRTLEKWPFFDFFHNQIKLQRFVDGDRYSKISRMRQKFDDQMKPSVYKCSKSNEMEENRGQTRLGGDIASLEISPSPTTSDFHYELLLAIVKHQATFNPDSELRFWTLVANELNAKGKIDGGRFSRIEKCENTFEHLVTIYLMHLKTDIESGSSSLDNWPSHKMFKELNLETMLPGEQFAKIKELRSKRPEPKKSVKFGPDQIFELSN